ncbi:MAG: transglutaminase family protein [Polyangiaceae bacterium]
MTRFRVSGPLSILFVLAATSLAGGAPAKAGTGEPKDAPADRRFTDETPDGMIERAKARALAQGASDEDVLSAITTMASLVERANYGSAKAALETVAAATSIAADVRMEASILARSLAADSGSTAGRAADAALGLVQDLAILGPFRDTGGGLDRKEGPEATARGFADTRARHSWGTIDVAWRIAPPSFAGPDGLPLDLFIHPRRESCTYLATVVTPDGAPGSKASFGVHVAASGQLRVAFDGELVGKSDDVHRFGQFDRVAARIETTAGPHVLAVKNCSGALDDDGRVRIRLDGDGGGRFAGKTSVELGVLAAAATSKSKIDVVPTPLGRALAGTSADPSRQLGRIVLRTLGGADDMRSPRAPGLLDTLTRSPGLDADRVAMAGFVAPSGANRSGLLNRARVQAVETHDASTLGFVDRRLTAEHVNARMVDWAMASYTAAGLDAKTDGEAVFLGARIRSSLGTESLRIGAMRSLATFVDGAGGKAPSFVLEELAGLASSYKPALWLQIRDALAKRGVRDGASVEAAARRTQGDAVKAAHAAFDGGLEDAGAAIAIARTVSRTGAHAAARDLFASVVKFAPNHAEGWSSLADETAAAMPTNEDAKTVRAKILGYLARARDLSPGDARTRASLALRVRGAKEGARPAEDADASKDVRYLVPSETILARRKGIPKGPAPDVAERQLHWLRAVVLHPDKRVSQLIHYGREIVVEPRTQEELVEDIPSEGDTTEILRARVHRKGGGTAFPTEEHNEGRRPRIRWPDLRAGDVVEVAIRSWTSTPVGGRGDPPFHFTDYAGSTSTRPLLYNEVVVESPAEHPIYLDVLHGKADRREDKREGDTLITRLVWDAPVSVEDEPLAPALSEVVPVIVGSSFKTWAEFRAWYAEAVRGFTEPDDEVRRLAKELTKGKTTRDEKLAALFQFVADDIRYVNYVSGEWWLPNRPQQLLARREGDCDDKALLLITLLKSVGIEAEEVLVQTRMTGQPSLVLAKDVAIPMFDHGIAFIPKGPGAPNGIWLDATSPQSRLGPIPSMDARGVALRMDGPAEITKLPAGSPDDHGSDITWNVELDAQGAAKITAEERHTGDSAFWLRTYLTEAGSRQQYVEQNMLARWFPSVEVDKKVDFTGDLAKGNAVVKYAARSEGAARHEDGELVVGVSPSVTLASQLAPLPRRTLPVVLPPYMAPSHEFRTIRIRAPEGHTWADLPPGGDENGGSFGRAHLEMKRDPKDPRVVVVRRDLVWDEHVIGVDKYEAWRGFIQRVDSLMHRQLRLVKSGAQAGKAAAK